MRVLLVVTALVTMGAAPKDERGALDKACKAGKAVSCVDLGYLWQQGDRGPEDQGKALALFQSACDLKEPQGCYETARYYQIGKLVKPDAKRAVQLFQSACDGGYLESCKSLAAIYVEGKLAPADLTHVRALHGKSCALGDGKSCYELGMLWQEGKGGDANLTKARASFAAGCEAQDPRSCLQIGTMTRDGIGGAADPTAAKSYFDTACSLGGARFCGQDAGAPAVVRDDAPCKGGTSSARCMITSAQRYTPAGGAEKLRPSRDFFQKKCAANEGVGCYKVGLILHDDDAPAARIAYDKGCKAGSQEACVNLGFMYVGGQGGTVDVGKARALFGSACDGGDALGCLNQAIHMLNASGPHDDKVVLAKLETACTGGEPIGCFDAGVMYKLGIGVAADATKAAALLQSACRDGVEEACTGR